MPVQPVISLEQIVIIVAFLIVLFALMWFVKRHRGGITSRIHADRRMQHIEDLSLAPQQRLHLIEVDGRTFLVHAGKGHAASFIAVDGKLSYALDTPSATPAAPRRQAKPSPKKPAAAAPATKPKNAFATFCRTLDGCRPSRTSALQPGLSAQASPPPGEGDQENYPTQRPRIGGGAGGDPTHDGQDALAAILRSASAS